MSALDASWFSDRGFRVGMAYERTRNSKKVCQNCGKSYHDVAMAESFGNKEECRTPEPGVVYLHTFVTE